MGANNSHGLYIGRDGAVVLRALIDRLADSRRWSLVKTHLLDLLLVIVHSLPWRRS